METTDDALIITRPTSGDDARRLVRRVMNRHGTAKRTRPLRCQTGHGDVWANAWALPFPDGRFTRVSCLDVIENVRDDEALIDELARVLAPGGRLFLRVPATGPIAGLDPYNLFHYLIDVTGRGSRSPETDEIGWRRHYSLDEIAHLLNVDRFTITRQKTSGIGLEQLAIFSGMALFRWLRPADGVYRRTQSVAMRVGEIEKAIPTGRYGFTLAVEATRLA